MKKLFFYFGFFLTFNSIFASNYYWVNGGGKWSDHGNHWATTSGGNIFHVDVPSPSDDVYIDANSFSSSMDTLTIDTTIVNCRSFIWTNTKATYVYFPHFYGLDIYGSLKLNVNLTWGGSAVTFKSSGQDSVDFGGCSISGNLKFDGTGQWKLLSDINYTSGQVSFYNGNFYSNNHNIIAGTVGCSGDSIFLGTSVITCSIWSSQGNSVAISSNLATINANTFWGGINQHFYKVKATDHFEIKDNTHCDSVIAKKAILDNGCFIKYLEMQSPSLTHLEGSTNSTIHRINISSPAAEVFGELIIDSLIFADSMYVDVSGATITINSFIDLNGLCRKWAFINGLTSAGSIIINSGSVSLNYLRVKNISATGPGTIQAYNSIDEGNVSGIQFHSPAPRNFYWVNGTGQWNDPNHWSSVTGGAGETCLPNRYDSVFFDSNSFTGLSDTVYANTQIACKYMSWNTNNNPIFYNSTLGSNEVRIYGSLILCTNMKWRIGSEIYLLPDTLNSHLNTCGKPFLSAVYFDGTGETILDDSISFSSYPGNIFIKGGILRTSGKSIYATKVNIDLVNTGNFTPGIYLDTSFIKCTNWSANNFPVFGPQSEIVCSFFIDQITNQYGNVICEELYHLNSSFNDVSASVINGGGTFRHLIMKEHIQGQNSYLLGPATIQKLTFNSPKTEVYLTITTDTLETVYKNLWLNMDSVNVSHYLNLNGGCNSIINIEGARFSVQGTYYIYSTIMKNVKFNGPAVNAMNSVDNGGNTGVHFTNPPARQLYWVNGTGKWDDENHWSDSSGGPGGNCIPTKMDDIYFDSNSFNTSHDTVQVWSPFIYAHSMTWSDSSYIKDNFIFDTPVFFLHGSFSLCPGMRWIFNSMTTKVNSDHQVNFISGLGAHINAAIYISDSTTWHLQSEFTSLSYLEVENLWTHGYPLRFNRAFLRNCFLDTSLVTCDQQLDGFSLHGDSATLIGLNGSANLNNCTFKFIDLDYAGMRNSIADEIRCNSIRVDSTFLPFVVMKPGAFSDISFSNNGFVRKCDVYGSEIRMYSKANFDTLRFLTLGQIINHSNVLSIYKELEITSSGAFPVKFQGFNQDTIFMTNGIQCFDYLYIKNLVATGGATFYAGVSSVDQGGNAGWIFAACPVTSIVDLSGTKFKIYPNPAKDHFYIEREGNEEYTIDLVNLNGQVVRKFRSNESMLVVYTNGLAKGMYSIRVQKLNEVAYRKIVID